MKKFLISIVVLSFAFHISNAQTEKGTQNLGLNLIFNYNKDNDFITFPNDLSTSSVITKTTAFGIGPNYSYFIADKLDIGINFSYSTSTTTNHTVDYATTNDNYPLKQFLYNYGGNIFIRKYYMYKDKIGFRTGAYIGYSKGNSTPTYSPSAGYYSYKSLNNDYFGGLKLDLVYYAAKKLGISATIVNLEYDHTKINNTTAGHENGDSVNFNFINNGLSLSVFYVIGTKK